MLFRKISFILENKFNLRFIFVTFVTFIGAILETLGLASFLPVLTSLLDRNNIEKYNFFNLHMEDFTKYSLLILLIIFIFKNLFLIFTKYTQLNLGRQVQIYLSNKLVKYYLYRNFEDHLKQSSSEIIRNIIFETTKFQGLINHFSEFFTEVLILIGIICLAFYFNTQYTVYIFCILSILFLGIFFSVKNKVRKLGQEDIIVNEKKINSINQILRGIVELKVFNKEQASSSIFEKSNDRLNAVNLLINIFRIVPRYLIEIFIILIVYLYFYLGIEEVQNIDKMLLNLSFYAIIMYRLLPSLNRILAASQSVKSLSPAVDVINAEFKKIGKDSFDFEVNYLKDFKKNLELKNLTFKYNDKELFNNQEILIKKNNLILLSGKNGSGKTTLINILLGLISPSNLKIFIDGENKNFFNFKKNKFKTSYVPAKPFILNDTIKNNIIFFDKEKKHIFQNLSEQKWFKDFIEKFPNKYDKIITENGKNISEGEKQKIALARALYNSPSILILDEPTSNLDLKSKENFYEMIYEMKKEVTILLVSHEDIENVKYDYNIHLEEGKIIIQ